MRYITMIASLLLFTLVSCGPSSAHRSQVKEENASIRVLEIPRFEDSVAGVQASERDILEKTNQALDRLVNGTADQGFTETFGALDRMNSELMRVWSRLYLLMDTSPFAEIREAAAESVVRIEQFYIHRIDLNEDLYQTLKTVAAQLKDMPLSAEELRYIELVLQAYEQEGMALQPAERELLKSEQTRLSELTTAILGNMNNALGDIALSADALSGLSAEQLAQLIYDPSTNLYTVRTSTASNYRMVMRKAINPGTRKKVLRARYQRAMVENGPLMLEVVQLRQKIAHRLGFTDWADYRIDGRMARDGETAQTFLENLDQRLTEKFLREQSELLEMKRLDLELPEKVPLSMPLEDVDYYMDQLVKARYAVDTEALRVYFPEQDVIPGMMQAVGEVFGFTFQEKPAPQAWVDDLRYFELYDQSTGQLMGAFYLDLHPRPGKYTHFAEYSLIDGRRREDGTYQAPLCVIVGNFPVPTLERPALWSYEELGTFIHEFGHVLHTILNETQLSAFAGTSVPKDFVEVASQVLERWLEDPSVLHGFARHYQSGEPFPSDTLQKILAAQSALMGHSYRRQISFGLADLRLHRIEDEALLPTTPEQLYAMSNVDFSRYYPVDFDTGFLASFEHLFGGYDAGYYSYAWADVIAADVAGTFRQSAQGFHDEQLGQRLRRSLYAKGNSQKPEDTIREFLGREFNDQAFLDELFRVRPLL